MARLFTYTIPVDDGAAPNPFYGMCSLAICKPGIRRVAQIGDWVVGLASKNSPNGDRSGQLVYAMRVEEVVTMQEYDLLAPTRWPHRIPNIQSLALHERLGDCIYDYSNGVPIQRRSVHDEGNKDTDIGGKNVLISKDFYYFGSNAIPLPPKLQKIRHQTQGHKSTANADSFACFESWIRSVKPNVGQLYGWPDYVIDWDNEVSCGSCTIRKIDDLHDPEC